MRTQFLPPAFTVYSAASTSCSSSSAAGTTRQRGAKWWCAREDTAVSRWNIAEARCHCGKFLRLPSRTVCKLRWPGHNRECRRSGRKRSGRQRPTIPGIETFAARCKSGPRSGRSRRTLRWPGPALRPKRSALRAPQGCAPGQANDQTNFNTERTTNGT